MVTLGVMVAIHIR